MNMKRIKKTKNQVIVVPSAQSSEIKTRLAGQETKKTIQKTKALSKPRLIRSKENTLSYYNCLIDQIANPSNQKVKITQLAHQCKCTKKEVTRAQQEHKKQLVKKVAQDYLTLGKNLGRYLHADIVDCAKELKK